MLRFSAAAFAVLLGVASAHAEPRSTGPAKAPAAEPGAMFGKTYCTDSGGVVESRIPTYGTNGGSTLALAGPKLFCNYTAKNGDSSIWVLLSTLVTPNPTLAALAYYAEVPFVEGSCQGSPGSCYCTQLGGTDLFGGINAAGGGWVLSTDSTNVLDACIFPDLSVIDTYGLFYHSAGIIRGRNLANKLRYKNPN
jgi:hypothetical protein